MKLAILPIVLLPLTMSATIAMAEDELPRELLLRCELKDTTFVKSNGKTDFHEDTVVKDFHLKDGVFEFTSGFVPLGTNCKLSDGKIGRKFSRTSTSRSAEFGPGVEKRESFVLLTRATGQMLLQIRVWYYTGEVIKGEPSLTMTSHDEGVCRSIGKPLF
jgi:hypothetical protein